MQMCSAMVYCKIILRGNKSWGRERGEEEMGKLHYLVVAAMGRNDANAFVSALKTLKYSYSL